MGTQKKKKLFPLSIFIYQLYQYISERPCGEEREALWGGGEEREALWRGGEEREALWGGGEEPEALWRGGEERPAVRATV